MLSQSGQCQNWVALRGPPAGSGQKRTHWDWVQHHGVPFISTQTRSLKIGASVWKKTLVFYIIMTMLVFFLCEISAVCLPFGFLNCLCYIKHISLKRYISYKENEVRFKKKSNWGFLAFLWWNLITFSYIVINMLGCTSVISSPAFQSSAFLI